VIRFNQGRWRDIVVDIHADDAEAKAPAVDLRGAPPAPPEAGVVRPGS
jgi:hypothetical protein